MAQIVKRSYKYRFHPTPGQAFELARTFGCVRLVYNKALEERTRAYTMEGRRVSYAESSARLTEWKKTPALAFLGEVRSLARKEKGSANRDKARQKVARLHARIADRRRDFLHKLPTRLVRENQAVVIEDLAVRNMVQNGKLARAISDASWRELRSMLEYKAAWYGRGLVVIDRWFPSSRLCSACGTIQQSMPLGVRTWECSCGVLHDRDVNAARNILAAGLADR